MAAVHFTRPPANLATKRLLRANRMIAFFAGNRLMIVLLLLERRH